MRKFLPFVLFTAAVLSGGCARPTASNARSAPPLTGDAKALQGAWAIVSVEDGHVETLTGAAKKDAEEMMKDVRLVFDGYRMIIIEKGEDEPVPFTLDEVKSPKVMALTLGGQESPYAAPTTARSGVSYAARPTTAFGTARTGSVRGGTSYGTYRGTAYGSASPPPRAAETWRWIYKLEGDTLVIAFIKKNKTLVPTEFKPRAEATQPGQPPIPGVTVITLKRTTEPVPLRVRGGTQRADTRPFTVTTASRPVTAK